MPQSRRTALGSGGWMVEGRIVGVDTGLENYRQMDDAFMLDGGRTDLCTDTDERMTGGWLDVRLKE